MKYYRRNPSSSAKVKKIMFRILFVIVAAFVILMLTIILGLHLKSKVAEAEKAISESKENAGIQISRDNEQTEDNISAAPQAFGGGIDLLSAADTDDIVVRINDIASIYDTVVLNLTDSNGNLLYQSPALCELLRMPCSTDDENYTRITTAISAAKIKNLHISAVFTPLRNISSVTSAALIDGTIMAELASLGVNEILILVESDSEDGISYEDANRFRSYITECSGMVGSSCRIGVVLPDDIFLNAENAKLVQMIAGAASFLAIDFDSSGFDVPEYFYLSVSDSIQSLVGTFSVYNLRVFIDSSERTFAAAEYEACLDNSVSNICFSTPYTEDELIFSANKDIYSAETETTVETTSDDDRKNPYAGMSFSEKETSDEESDTFDDQVIDDARVVDDVVESEPYETNENGSIVKPWY